MKTILSHANLINCVEPQVRPDPAVLIEDGRIRAILPIGEADSAGGDAQDNKRPRASFPHERGESAALDRSEFDSLSALP